MYHHLLVVILIFRKSDKNLMKLFKQNISRRKSSIFKVIFKSSETFLLTEKVFTEENEHVSVKLITSSHYSECKIIK